MRLVLVSKLVCHHTISQVWNYNAQNKADYIQAKCSTKHTVLLANIRIHGHHTQALICMLLCMKAAAAYNIPYSAGTMVTVAR